MFFQIGKEYHVIAFHTFLLTTRRYLKIHKNTFMASMKPFQLKMVLITDLANLYRNCFTLE